MATSSTNATKTGKACAKNYLGIFSGGDGSIGAAKKDGNITNVASVDIEYTNIIGVYGSACTIVKGN